MARLAAARLRDKGIDPGPLLAETEISPEQVAVLDAWMDAGRQVKFLNLAAEALQDPMLGFHLAMDFDIRQVSLLYFVLASSPTLGEAFARVARYSSVANESVALNHTSRNGATLRFGHRGVPQYVDRHQMEFWMTALLRISRHLTGTGLRPVRVSVTHPRSHGSEAMEDFLRCEMSFQENSDEIRFAAGAEALPLENADPYLSRVLVSQCEQATADHLRTSGSLRGRVEAEIAQGLPHGKGHMDDVAATLGMSRRTLARHLAEEEVTFMEILEGVRRDMARHFLKDSDLPISEIAWLLGYSETSAFTTSFRRWTGHTPRQMRNAH